MVAEGIMFIDIQTAKNLELVRNNLTNKATHTLYSVLNHCHTPMGMRLLRTCILQPSNGIVVMFYSSLLLMYSIWKFLLL